MTIAARRPPAMRWMRKNLFSTPLNVALTLVLGGGIVYLIYFLIRVLATSSFEILRVNLALFMVGTFPRGQLWRVVAAVLLLAIMLGIVGGLLKASARERSEKAGVPMAVGGAARNCIGEAMNRTDYADQDFSALLDYVCEQAGIAPPRLARRG